MDIKFEKNLTVILEFVSFHPVNKPNIIVHQNSKIISRHKKSHCASQCLKVRQVRHWGAKFNVECFSTKLHIQIFPIYATNALHRELKVESYKSFKHICNQCACFVVSCFQIIFSCTIQSLVGSLENKTCIIFCFSVAVYSFL